MVSLRIPLSFLLILFAFLSPYLGRNIIVPAIYIPLYLYGFYLFFIAKDWKMPFFYFSFIILMILILFFNIQNTYSFGNAIIYLLMWILNIFLAYVIQKYDKENYAIGSISDLGFFLFFLLLYSFFLSAPPSMFFGGMGININLVVFILVITFYQLFLNKKTILGSVFFSFALLTFSRMQILMQAAFIFFNNKFVRIIFYLLIPFIFYFLYLNFVETSLVKDFQLYFTSGVFLFSEQIDDVRRIYLMIAGIETIKELFPFGTGLGLENFKYHASKYIVNAYTSDVRLSLTHNFYLSYLAISGIMIFPLLAYIFIPLKNNTQYRILYLIFLIGIAFNEYITAPFFWVVYALAMRDKFKNY